MQFKHKSVLFDECMSALDITPGGIYVDGTLGAVIHTEFAKDFPEKADSSVLTVTPRP